MRLAGSTLNKDRLAVQQIIAYFVIDLICLVVGGLMDLGVRNLGNGNLPGLYITEEPSHLNATFI